jgi:hypothetical protein
MGTTDPASRALAMMQVLAPGDAAGTPLAGENHGIVDQMSAVKALAQIFAVVDHALRAGSIPEDRGKHAMLMLMVLREHVLSIPDPPGDERLFRQDLQAVVDALSASGKVD